MNMPIENMANQMPTENKLPIEQSAREAWDSTSGFKGTFWLCILTIFVIEAIYRLVHAGMMHDLTWAGILQIEKPMPKPTVPAALLDFFYGLFQIVISSGLVYIAIRKVANLSVKARMLWHPFQMRIAVKLILATVLVALIAMGIALLSLIPGIPLMHAGVNSDVIKFIVAVWYAIVICAAIYINIRLMLFPQIILDRNLGPIEALKLSFHSTRDNFWRIVGIGLLTIFIILISIIPLGIGLIWSLPFAYCLNSTVYKKLVGIQMSE